MAVKMIGTLKTTQFEDLPTICQVMSRLTIEDRGNVSFQSVDVMKNSIPEITSNHTMYSFWPMYLQFWLPVVRRRLMTPLLAMMLCMHSLQIFFVPLNHASVNCSVFMDEWDAMVDYAKWYLDLVRDDYRVIWWKVFQSVDTKYWSNILVLVELFICIPVANGCVERLFSILKIIK